MEPGCKVRRARNVKELVSSCFFGMAKPATIALVLFAVWVGMRFWGIDRLAASALVDAMKLVSIAFLVGVIIWDAIGDRAYRTSTGELIDPLHGLAKGLRFVSIVYGILIFLGIFARILLTQNGPGSITLSPILWFDQYYTLLSLFLFVLLLLTSFVICHGSYSEATKIEAEEFILYCDFPLFVAALACVAALSAFTQPTDYPLLKDGAFAMLIFSNAVLAAILENDKPPSRGCEFRAQKQVSGQVEET